MEADLQRMFWTYWAERQQHFRARLTPEDKRERLERFLSWLMDARWYPQTDTEEIKRRRAELRTFRSILARMRAFSSGKPDVRLQRGLAEWENYGQSLTILAMQHVRRAPDMQTSPLGKAETEIAERLVCATLVIAKLWPGESVYGRMRRLLAEPATLPRLITLADDRAKNLRRPNGRRLLTALQAKFVETGEEMPLRPYSRSEKALQSCVGRLKARINAGMHFSYSQLLERLYSQYQWSQWAKAGFSEAEAEMLRSIVPS